MINSGIYRITNMKTGHFYIGQTSNFMRRWAEHRKELEKGMHHNERLQYEWSIYGAASFKFEVVERCEVGRLNEREKWWIDHKKPYFNNGYWAPYEKKRRAVSGGLKPRKFRKTIRDRRK